MIQVRMASCSQIGARSQNEDAVAFGQGPMGHFAVLADGAGGHRRGAEAAQHAVAQVESVLKGYSGESLAFSSSNLTHLVQLAHAELLQRQDSTQLDARMHCTIVALWIEPSVGHVLWTHVGDSRLYRLRHSQVDIVTADDSVVQRMVQAGLIRPDQMREHPQKNQLLAALGMEGEIEPHTVVRPVQLSEGDAFLLCSDGWWEGFEANDLVKTLSHALDPEQWLDAMRKLIEARGRPRQDNFSAVAVWIGDPGEVTHPGEEDTRPRL
jgi:PPM family protein phosphatase